MAAENGLRKRTLAPRPAAPPSSTITRRRRRRREEEGDYDDLRCEECGSGEMAPELLICDGCDCGYHLFCLKPILAKVPAGQWLCSSCSIPKKPAEFPLVQTKIVDFFRIRRAPESPDLQLKGQELKKRRKRPSSLITLKKKKRKLLPFNPTQDPARKLEQMASLARALVEVGAEFSNELTYRSGMAPRSANRAAFENGGMQVLPAGDLETLNLCRRMVEQGEWPPLMVEFDPYEGLTVRADRFIRDLTIITEYAGDVDYLINREHDDGDSMMTLLTSKDTSKSLVICPDRRANVARFMNGINNHTPDGKKKQNVKCVRYAVDGQCRVLLVAIRDIPKGERLYYDYNGYEHEYPTHNFV